MLCTLKGVSMPPWTHVQCKTSQVRRTTNVGPPREALQGPVVALTTAQIKRKLYLNMQDVILQVGLQLTIVTQPSETSEYAPLTGYW
jgi:hypothetical protein